VSAITPDNNPANNQATAVVTVVNPQGPFFARMITPKAKVGAPAILSKSQFFASGTTNISSATWRLASFVDSIFRTLTHRGATATELANYVKKLQNGLTRTAFVTHIWKSEEHRRVQVNTLFQTFLHRSPTSQERNLAVEQLKNGISEWDLALDLLTSSEYLQSHPTPEALVIGFYQDVMGEVPDPATQQAAVQALGNTTVHDFFHDLIFAAESLALTVDWGYRNILGRSATNAEILNTVGKIQSQSIQPEAFVIKILASSEFVDRAAAKSKLL
jgi:hypothetical protein